MAGKVLALMKDCKGLHTGAAGIRVKYDSNNGATFLQACDNVVVDRLGRISRRKGALNKNTTALLDVYSDGVDCLGWSGSALYRVRQDYSLVGLRSGLNASLEMFFTSTPEGIFYSNGLERGRVARFGASFNWDRGEEEYSPVQSMELYGPPSGITHIHYHNGHMFCAVGNVAYYSDYRSYGNFYLERDMLQFPDVITGFASSVRTLFVFTTKHVFAYPGTMRDAVETFASANPLIPGTVANNDSIRSELSTLPMWMTLNGLMVGLPSGEVRSVTEKRLILPDTVVSGKAACHKGHYVAILNKQ